MATRNVEHIMNKIVLFQDIDETLEEIKKNMDQNNAEAIVVMRHGIPVGIITILAMGKNLKRKAGEVMSPFIYVNHDADLAFTKELMAKNKITHVPVMQDKSVVGLVTINDIDSYIF